MFQLVTIESFTSPWDAYIVRGLLESEGIPAHLASEHHIWANWPLSLALGGVRLQVTEELAHHAQQVLTRRKEKEFEAALWDELHFEENVCHACGSTQLEIFRSVFSCLISVLMGMFAGTPFPPKVAGHKCMHCGHKAWCDATTP